MNKKFMYIYLLLLPIIDLITSVTSRLFSNVISLGIIIKTIFLAIMIYYLLFKSTSKHKKLSIGFLCLIIIYILFYFIFKLEYMNLNIFINEFKYIIKLMYFPMLLSCLYCYFDDKKISKKELISVLKTTLLMYIILLILPLITNSGFSTYLLDMKGTIGWFYSANEISIILILLFPFIYTQIKNKKILLVIIPIIIIFVISTIGTKASMIGLIIDTSILMVLSCFSKKEKKLNFHLIIYSFITLLFAIFMFTNSTSLNNLKTSVGIQQEENKIVMQKQQKAEEELIKQEIEKLEETLPNQPINEENIVFNKYIKALLSDRDLYVNVTYKLYKKHYNTNTLLFGLGYSNTPKYNSFGIEKLIEIDPLDIYFHSGLIALIIILLPFIYYLYHLIRKAKISINLIFYTLIIGMIFCVSCISGHTLMAPAVSVYIILYFLLAFTELGLINKKDKNIEKNKVTIYALHLNYGGVEKNICTKANILSKIYDVEIISLYKLTDKPVFKLNKKVKVKYLTENIKPNREEFKKAIKEKRIFKILKEGFYAIKVLYLKDTLITQSMISCNSEIIISTRIDFTKKLLKNNEYKNIKVAEEHIYHNNDKKYLKDISKILKEIDYLMPSSNYLTDYYKNLNKKYNHKIITNDMPIETDNSISNLKNKNIISVGRLDKVKGYNDLINLFGKIDNKKWTLNIVGNGPEYNNLDKQIKELGLENNLKLLGFKNTDELNELYANSSIYIMTSYEESFGLVLLEAASHGLPIIAYSSALGAKEILKDNNGILISKRNEKEMISSLNKLISDIKLRKKYSEKSLKISEEYSYDNIEKKVINFYKNIGGKHDK